MLQPRLNDGSVSFSVRRKLCVSFSSPLGVSIRCCSICPTMAASASAFVVGFASVSTLLQLQHQHSATQLQRKLCVSSSSPSASASVLVLTLRERLVQFQLQRSMSALRQFQFQQQQAPCGKFSSDNSLQRQARRSSYTAAASSAPVPARCA
jgi:hypothetical protein